MRMVEELNQFFIEHNLPITIDIFGSLFRFRFVDSYWGITEALMFLLMRMNGVETNIQGNCFLTTVHTAKDIRNIIEAVKKSLKTLLEENFFYEAKIELKEESVPVAAPQPVIKTDSRKEINIDDSQIQKLKDLLLRDLKKISQ